MDRVAEVWVEFWLLLAGRVDRPFGRKDVSLGTLGGPDVRASELLPFPDDGIYSTHGLHRVASLDVLGRLWLQGVRDQKVEAFRG